MNARADIDIEKASKMWNDGQSAGMIADQFGISRNVVIGLANRNRDLFPNKKTGTTEVTVAAPIQRREYKPSAMARIDVDVYKAAQLWNEGMSQERIAARLGTNKHAIRRLTGKYRELFPKRPKSEFVWTDEKIAAAAKMWADGMQPREIGEKFGTTKAGLLGVAFRNRALFPARGVGRKSPRGTRKSLTIIPKAKQRRVVEPDFGPAEPQIPATEYDLMRLPYSKTLIDLEPCECKWPLTSGGPFMFCAETTEARASYCTNHLERSLPRPEYRRLKAA
ncbi:hypothetical protein IB244_31190 [Rhizobium sp. RHZ02]|uniref:GcrA family cell cycle regulator n=1 Tax=Rhizobium sp. RHZ02 TaxID=2769306 RepID=UPI00177E179B|nr:GcrA family cell cycle regulator [Rhizobium sp. RHZ02]MBD9455937.1 hypothetical protein [Rhizobium sp. RHZ02]